MAFCTPMHRFHFLQFDDTHDGDDVAVKAEPAWGQAAEVPQPAAALPTRPPARKKRDRDSVDADVEMVVVAAVKAEPSVVCDGPPVVEPAAPAAAFRHQCPHCSYRSDKKIDVVVHVRTHTGEKPFKVRHCL